MTINQNQRKQGFRIFTIGMIGYAVVVMATGFLTDASSALWLRITAALLPIAIGLWAMGGWLAAVRTFDELHRRNFSEAGLIALGVTALLTFTYGFLEAYQLAPRISMFMVVPLIAASYTLALPFVFRRYR